VRSNWALGILREWHGSLITGEGTLRKKRQKFAHSYLGIFENRSLRNESHKKPRLLERKKKESGKNICIERPSGGVGAIEQRAPDESESGGVGGSKRKNGLGRVIHLTPDPETRAT